MKKSDKLFKLYHPGTKNFKSSVLWGWQLNVNSGVGIIFLSIQMGLTIQNYCCRGLAPFERFTTEWWGMR
jgi:hypothetical protein